MVHAALAGAPLDARFLVGGAIAACVPQPFLERNSIFPHISPQAEKQNLVSDANHAREFLQRILGTTGLDLGPSSVDALIAQTVESISGYESSIAAEDSKKRESSYSIAKKYALCLQQYADTEALHDKTLGFQNTLLEDIEIETDSSDVNQQEKRRRFVSLALFSCLEVEIRFSAGHYDARSRAAFWRAANIFCIDGGTLASAETTLATILMAENEAVEASENESFEETKKRRRKIRMMKIAAASTISGFMVGFTGGVLAPAIIPALASVGMGMGLTGLSSATSSVIVGSLFGAAGASMAAKKIDHLTADVTEFEFEACNRVAKSRVRDMMELTPLTVIKGGREECPVQVTVAGSMLGWEVEGACDFGIQYEPFSVSGEAVSVDAVALAVERAVLKSAEGSSNVDSSTTISTERNTRTAMEESASVKMQTDTIEKTGWEDTKKFLKEMVTFYKSNQNPSKEGKPGWKCWVIPLQTYPLKDKKHDDHRFQIGLWSLNNFTARHRENSCRETMLCAEAGIYTLIFDNSSAILKNAYIKYRYAVIPPSTKFIPQWLTDKDEEDVSNSKIASDKNVQDPSIRAPLSLHLTYFIPGWLVPEHCGYHWKGKPAAGAVALQFEAIAEELLPLSECLAVRWESVMLEDLGNALVGFLKSIAAGKLKKLAIDYAIPGLLGTVTMPLKLLLAVSVFDNLWSAAVNRATSAGIALAEALSKGTHGHRPATLIGYSLGARVVFQCLEELGKRGIHGLVHHAVLIGAPCTTDENRWQVASAAVAGRIANVYYENDWILGLLHRTVSPIKYIAGLRRISHNKVENFDLTRICPNFDGHGNYRKNLATILEKIEIAGTTWYLQNSEHEGSSTANVSLPIG